MQRETDKQGPAVTPSPKQAEGDGKIMTLDEAAEYLKTSYSTVYRLVVDGELRAFRIRNAWRTSTGACQKSGCPSEKATGDVGSPPWVGRLTRTPIPSPTSRAIQS